MTQRPVVGISHSGDAVCENARRLVVQRARHRIDNLSFRTLYWDILAYKGQPLYADVLLPWQPHAERAMEELRPYGSADAIGWRRNRTIQWACDDPFQVDLWEWYALSRVSDLLLLPFQSMSRPKHGDLWHPWAGPTITIEERTEWFRSLGMRPVEHPTFHPFYHEIVEVESTADPAEPISLVQTIWPGFLLDHLLVCRAGVHVRGGSQHIVKVVAEDSTLYWTYRRNNRPTSDQSHGWGHNSQWRTDFRRDYEDATAFWYNVDGDAPDEMEGKWADPDDDDGLTPIQRRELVVNRCFIVTPSPPPKMEPYPFPWPYKEDR